MSASKKTRVRQHMLNAVAKQSGVDALVQQLEDARAGMYTHMVKAAITAGTPELFSECAETLANDFRANNRGIAVKYDCPQQKTTSGDPKVDADGNPVYCVPSCVSAARSHLTQALELGVDMGKVASPQPYRAIVDAKDVAKAEAAARKASPDDKLIEAAYEVLNAIGEKLEALEGDALKAACLLINETAAQVDKVA